MVPHNLEDTFNLMTLMHGVLPGSFHGGLTMVTHKMNRDKINGRLLDVLLAALYFSYNTNKPYIEQVEQHMAMLPGVFKNEFGKVLKFDQA